MKTIIYSFLIVVVAVGCGYCVEKFGIPLDERVEFIKDARQRLREYELDLFKYVSYDDSPSGIISAMNIRKNCAVARLLLKNVAESFTYAHILQADGATVEDSKLLRQMLLDVYYNLAYAESRASVINESISNLENPAVIAVSRDVLKELREAERKLKEIPQIKSSYDYFHKERQQDSTDGSR